MKKLLLILVSTTLITFCNAQSTDSKIRELGLNVSLWNSGGIRYLMGNDKASLRITINSLAGNKYLQGNRFGSFGLGVNIGVEKRKSIFDKVSFYYGSDLILGLSRQYVRDPRDVNTAYSPGIGAVLGFVYYINDRISFSTEIIPSLVYHYETHTYTNINGTINTTHQSELSYGLNGSNNSLANFTLSFRLGNK